MVQPTTIEFLKELKSNNSKSWFEQNRKRYDKMKSDYISLAGRILEQMKDIDPSLDMVTAKDCIFRINRDVRFSADKSPYKTNLGIALHPGGKKFNLAAYYLHIEPGQSFIGGGLWMPEAPLLSKVRKEIHYFYHDLVDILNNPLYKKTFGSLDVEDGQKLTRPPKGYEAEDPAIEFLKLKSFTASTPLPDEMLTSDKLVGHIINTFTILKPLIGFINRGLMSDPDGGL
ncbi:MAG: DUF2461 domain-containing protein [Saprospiraceae bacterium]|nr:DUF2461 domain-containing protein [Saprospiraceae bacterium]MBP6566768.1 DUF2461 domain-containing protein [Saprospiraceae bacterium]